MFELMVTSSLVWMEQAFMFIAFVDSAFHARSPNSTDSALDLQIYCRWAYKSWNKSCLESILEQEEWVQQNFFLNGKISFFSLFHSVATPESITIWRQGHDANLVPYEWSFNTHQLSKIRKSYAWIGIQSTHTSVKNSTGVSTSALTVVLFAHLWGLPTWTCSNFFIKIIQTTTSTSAHFTSKRKFFRHDGFNLRDDLSTARSGFKNKISGKNFRFKFGGTQAETGQKINLNFFGSSHDTYETLCIHYSFPRSFLLSRTVPEISSGEFFTCSPCSQFHLEAIDSRTVSRIAKRSMCGESNHMMSYMARSDENGPSTSYMKYKSIFFLTISSFFCSLFTWYSTAQHSRIASLHLCAYFKLKTKQIGGKSKP